MSPHAYKPRVACTYWLIGGASQGGRCCRIHQLCAVPDPLCVRNRSVGALTLVVHASGAWQWPSQHHACARRVSELHCAIATPLSILCEGTVLLPHHGARPSMGMVSPSAPHSCCALPLAVTPPTIATRRDSSAHTRRTDSSDGSPPSGTSVAAMRGASSDGIHDQRCDEKSKNSTSRSISPARTPPATIMPSCLARGVAAALASPGSRAGACAGVATHAPSDARGLTGPMRRDGQACAKAEGQLPGAMPYNAGCPTSARGEAHRPTAKACVRASVSHWVGVYRCAGRALPHPSR